VFWALFTR